MAHSAYPHLGESAIEKLLDVLERVRRMPLACDPVLGQSTVNIGTIHGGRAPNVIPDHALAEVFVRLVDDGAGARAAVKEAAGDLADAREILCVPAVKLGALDGFETTVVAYTTDIPAFDGSWGEPFLFGPGSIHVAHSDEERVSKSELTKAVESYQKIARQLVQK
jgi:acetylornithine deacetylase